MTGSQRMARFQELLQPFLFDPHAEDAARDAQRLEEIRRALPPVEQAAPEGEPAALAALLEKRAAGVEKGLTGFLSERYRELARENLAASHSYAVLFAHTRLVDALHAFAFEVAWEEVGVLAHLTLVSGEKENRFRGALLPKKREMLAGMKATEEGATEEADEEEEAYFRRILADLEREVAELEALVGGWEAQRPALETFRPEREALLDGFVLFARGGYGRCELGFSSDLDTGYCVDPKVLAPGQVRVFQEMIVRMENLLRRGGLEPAHQYFEVGEDLTRFGEAETLHTVPSVLEGRALLGNGGLLARLQEQFRDFLPYEFFLKQKIGEFEAQPAPTLTEMDLKEHQGGLRSIQTPLWILGVTHRAAGFQSAQLIGLAREKGLLSTGDAARFLLGLEFLNELRNFIGLAEPYYQDGEARAALGTIARFVPNRIDDAVARLYLFRKNRFGSLDGLDSYRLRLGADVVGIARKLLAQVLDQTLSHQVGAARLLVHLGDKRIIRIERSDGEPVGGPAEIFPTGNDLLQLMAYVAGSGYDLSEPLKDALAEAVAVVQPPAADAAAGGEQAALFSKVVGAPYAHRALATMWEINDPLSEGWKSLLGSFIPSCDRLFYLLREARVLGMPVHRHVIRSLAQGQKNLEWLRGAYPEFHTLLNPTHVLALNWSLFLHAIGKPVAAGGGPERSAALAGDILEALGYDDPPLERLVGLLIENQGQPAHLNRTATYHDQAVVSVFETAERETVKVILLFLVNLSILQAEGERSAGNVLDLQRFFEDMSRILAELPGAPDAPSSLDLINIYLERKKADLALETRLHLLVQQAMVVGLERAVYEPLARLSPGEMERLERHRPEMENRLRQAVLAAPGDEEQENAAGRLFRILAGTVSEEHVAELTAEQAGLFSWFMAAFPNRHLLASRPAALAAQMAQFAGFEETRVRCAVLTGRDGRPEGLLIFARNLDHAHSRVAYALSRHHVNIVAGKVNPVRLGPDDAGFCYFFQISPLTSGGAFFPRDLENIILNETPRDLVATGAPRPFQGAGTRVEFLGNDRRGYLIFRQQEQYVRESAEFRHVRVTLRDQPFLFYKVAKVFDTFGIEVRQSLITTTGNLVLDYFYLEREDYERLRATNFVETFNRLIQMGVG